MVSARSAINRNAGLEELHALQLSSSIIQNSRFTVRWPGSLWLQVRAFGLDSVREANGNILR